MSSLRRLPSVDLADHASPALSSCPRNLYRHLSLPSLSLYRVRRGLPSLPPRKSHYRKCSRGALFRSPSCGQKQDGNSRRLASCRSMPARHGEHKGDGTVRSIARSISRKEALEFEGSVVYKDLCESVHLEIPAPRGCVFSSEPPFQSSVRAPVRPHHAEKSIEAPSVGVPVSLRMLKRRLSSKSEVKRPRPSVGHTMKGDPCTPPLYSDEVLSANLLSNVPDSVNCAFGMIIYMMESLQQHALRLRNAFVSEADAHFQMMMVSVRQEMQDSFVWLFQRVFACTPKLMLLTMMLLTDFAVHSMGGHIALAVPPLGEPPTYAIERSVPASMLSFDLRRSALDKSFDDGASFLTPQLNGNNKNSEPCFSEGGAGGGVARAVKVGGGMDGGTTSLNGLIDQVAMTSKEETYVLPNDTSNPGSCIDLYSASANLEENQSLAAMWHEALSEELVSEPLKDSRRILLAPVRAPALEADDYTCYDRTDLSYQHELIRDPSNPLLLANYAQFQHVVRHDHDRADELYKRAVKADPVDGELMGKYASFLWVAKEDSEAADEAYKAALAVDPTNAYYAGSYANFLWNSGCDQDNMSTPNAIQLEVTKS